MNFKDIHIGELIKKRVNECEIELSRICNFLQATPTEVELMFTEKSLNAEVLLRWSKLLKYDFFRIYSHHLILYSPPTSNKQNKSNVLPHFHKNVYTKEIINFILEQIRNNVKTKQEVITEYNIPKATLYKWLEKY